MSTQDIPDLVILGAGPAGAAAAAFAAEKNLSVQLLDRNQTPAVPPPIEWLPPGAGPQIDSINPREESVHRTSATVQEFTGKLLVAADGAESWAARELGIYPKMQCGHSIGCQWTALRSDLSKPGKKPSAELSLLFASDSLADYSYIYHAGDITLIGLVTDGPADTIESRFQDTVNWAKGDDALPADLTVDSNELVLRINR